MRHKKLLLTLALLLVGTGAQELASQIPAVPQSFTFSNGSDAIIKRLDQELQQLTKSGLTTQEEPRAHVIMDSLRALRCGQQLEKNVLVWGQREGGCLWGDGTLVPLNLANISANSDGGSIYTDVLTTYFGGFRTSFGTLVSATPDQEDSSQPADGREALQRLVAGGGNLVFGAQLPLLYVPVKFLNSARFTGLLMGRGAVDVAPLGASEQTRSASWAGAYNFRGQTSSNNGDVELFASVKGERVHGNNPLFVLPATVTDTATEVRTLRYRQFSVGARLWKTVLVQWTRYDCRECRKLELQNQLSITAQTAAP